MKVQSPGTIREEIDLIEIRPECERDVGAVRALHEKAFETPAEARLVDSLRVRADSLISLVAAEQGEVVGHILFSPVTLEGHPSLNLMGLAPMAVHPDRQRQGIGSALVTAGLERCRELNVAAVVVLGHPEFYSRFGFVPAGQFGIQCEYEVPADAFMAVELQPDALSCCGGLLKYHRAFNEL